MADDAYVNSWNEILGTFARMSIEELSRHPSLKRHTSAVSNVIYFDILAGPPVSWELERYEEEGKVEDVVHANFNAIAGYRHGSKELTIYNEESVAPEEVQKLREFVKGSFAGGKIASTERKGVA